jgi:hypothetical protein
LETLILHPTDAVQGFGISQQVFLQRKRSRFATFLADVIEKYASVLEIDKAESLSNNENQQDAVDTTIAA